METEEKEFKRKTEDSEEGKRIGKRKRKEGKKKNLKNKRINCKFTGKLKKFSNESMQNSPLPSHFSHVSSEETGLNSIVVIYFGNGKFESNKGYVSLVFALQMPSLERKKVLNFSCAVAVVDVSGKRKFIRTFGIDEMSEKMGGMDDVAAMYSIERYIARETLLNDRENLLPNDELTLKVDVSFLLIPPSNAEIESAINSSFEKEGSENPIIVLNLNSELGKRLIEVSSFFRDMCDILTNDKNAEIRLRGDNIDAFKNASRILMGVKTIDFDSLEEIVQVYIFADKYDIQNVIQACNNFFKEILDDLNLLALIDLTNETVKKLLFCSCFDDDALKRIVNRFLEKEKEGKLDFERKLEYEEDWILNSQIPNFHFVLNRGNKSKLEFYN